jgi:hypothetical protein
MVAFQGGQRFPASRCHPRRHSRHGSGHQHRSNDQCAKRFPLGAKYPPQVSGCYSIRFFF